MKLLLLCGSPRAGSTNEAVLRTTQHLSGPSIEANYFAGVTSLPHFNPDDDHDPLPRAVVAMRGAIGTADALLICTPEYAGDLPGSFKNLLDWTVGGVETDSKPVAWINASTSPMAAASTHRALGTVLTYTGCEIVDAACVHVPVPRAAIADGIVTAPSVRTAIGAVLAALSRHVAESRIRSERQDLTTDQRDIGLPQRKMIGLS